MRIFKRFNVGDKITQGHFEYTFTKIRLYAGSIDFKKIFGINYAWKVKLRDVSSYNPNEEIPKRVYGWPVLYAEDCFSGLNIEYFKFNNSNTNEYFSTYRVLNDVTANVVDISDCNLHITEALIYEQFMADAKIIMVNRETYKKLANEPRFSHVYLRDIIFVSDGVAYNLVKEILKDGKEPIIKSSNNLLGYVAKANILNKRVNAVYVV